MHDGEEGQETGGRLKEELFFILFEVLEPRGAERLPACLHVPLTGHSYSPVALHTCVTYLNGLGAGEDWRFGGQRGELASLPPRTPSASTPAGSVGNAQLDFFIESFSENELV